jgi:iron(III) transport system ATP-binding protein
VSPAGDTRQLGWETLASLFAGEGGESPMADILVRQEDVILGSDGLAASVESILYEGERYAARLRLNDGQIVRAFSRLPLSVGERVNVVIRSGWRL